MINVIIVPTDGSDHADKAVELAADIASKYAARMVILHVLQRHMSSPDVRDLCKKYAAPDDIVAKLDELDDSLVDIMTSATSAGYTPVSLPIPEEVLKGVGEAIVRKAEEVAADRGVTDIEVQVADGSPADSILQAAEYEHADMIIMGSRGLGKFAGLMMGSVSHKVSHLSTCTCVTVK